MWRPAKCLWAAAVEEMEIASKGAIVIRSLAGGLVRSAAVIVGTALLWRVSPALGSVAMLAGSCWMMLAGYRRQWRLHWLTCLLPATTAGGCYLLQSGLVHARPDPALLGLLAASFFAEILLDMPNIICYTVNTKRRKPAGGIFDMSMGIGRPVRISTGAVGIQARGLDSRGDDLWASSDKGMLSGW